MNTDRSEDGKDVLPPPPLSTAREAYLNGDFLACFAALDGMADVSAEDAREAALLRSRALLREHRAEEVIALLGPLLVGFIGIDEACTGRMLHAVAKVRCGFADEGMDLLRSVDSAARALGAHRTIRAEIAYWIAYAHWVRREYVASLRSARVAEAEWADVVSVRAATLRGFVAVAKERYPEALALFRSALESYARCRERDPDLAERIMVQIASLELTLCSRTVPGTHRMRAESSISDAGTRGVPGVFRMHVSALDAWLSALDGDRERAYRRARVAERLAPTAPWRAWALATRANVALAFGEGGIAAEFAHEALEIADGVQWSDTADEERVALLLLAECFASTDPPLAVSALARYEGLTTQVDASLVSRDDVRLWIIERFVRGLVQRIEGDVDGAAASFRMAHEAAMRVGYLWRGALALIELGATPCPSRHGDRFAFDEAAAIVAEHFPESFLARRLGGWTTAVADPLVARLPRMPREVLRRLLDGKSHKEIAADMGLAAGTVKNYVVAIHRHFEVTSTPQLMAYCYRRGFSAPPSEAATPPRRNGHARPFARPTRSARAG